MRGVARDRVVAWRTAIAPVAAVAALAIGAAACSSVDLEPTATPPVNPGPPEITTMGLVTGIVEDGRGRTWTLEDGTQVTRDARVDRRIHEGAGSPLLLVVGRDARGDWYAEIGTQQGMPADCLVLNEDGADWGTSIEIAGVLWPKATGFVAENGLVPLGTRYPGATRFCLDETAHVTLATQRR